MAISKKSFVNLDLQGNALVNPTIGANADMTKAGSFQYNSVANRLEYYNGATIETVANLNDITGALDFQGGYDAATNTPDLTAPAAGAVKQGYYWVVTAAGTFFTETLAIGDSLFAKVDDPSALTDWVIVQGNVDLASESTPGITYLATSAQVATGTETGAYAVNPATLQGKINAQSYTAAVKGTLGGQSDWVYDSNVGCYLATVTHNLGDNINFNLNYDTTSADFQTDKNINVLYIYSNIEPEWDTVVNIVKTGGNL